MSEQEVQEMRRSVVQCLAELCARADCQGPSLASRNIDYHSASICDAMDRLFSGRADEPMPVDDFQGW
jgi:hypothetical protein